MSRRGQPSLVVLDRDGVINRDSRDFVKSPAEWVPLPGSIDAIARLSNAGYTVAVASNQSGLARGLFDRDTLEAMHQKLRNLVNEAGGSLGEIVVCPHGPDAGCDCRKPLPGLLHQLGAKYRVALDGVPVVGDSLRDLEAARAAGARPLLVRSGNGRKTEAGLPPGLRSVPVYDDLAAAASALLDDH